MRWAMERHVGYEHACRAVECCKLAQTVDMQPSLVSFYPVRCCVIVDILNAHGFGVGRTTL